MKHSTPLEPPLLVDVEEAARLLSISRSNLYGLMDAGELPYRKIGARRLVPRAGLVEFAGGRPLRGRMAP